MYDKNNCCFKKNFSIAFREEICKYFDAFLVLDECQTSRWECGGSEDIPGCHWWRRRETRDQEIADSQLWVSIVITLFIVSLKTTILIPWVNVQKYYYYVITVLNYNINISVTFMFSFFWQIPKGVYPRCDSRLDHHKNRALKTSWLSVFNLQKRDFFFLFSCFFCLILLNMPKHVGEIHHGQ